MRTLDKLTIKNFKSIREQTLELGPLNVFIGANGSGKSNLIEVFRFIHEIVSQNLSGYTIKKGGANALLHYGRKKSQHISFLLEFGKNGNTNIYELILEPTDNDGFVIKWERAGNYDKANKPSTGLYDGWGTWNKEESKLKDACVNANREIARHVMHDLESYRVYHFHDVSDMAAVKGFSDVEDNRILKSRAENLAAFLYWMQEKKHDHFANIQDAIRQIAPFFDKFVLAPRKLNESQILLEWREKGSDAYFNASSFSDGTMRFVCLATLLLQPDLPSLVLIDEPELGLHPSAIAVLASLLESASTRAQVVVATQSVTLINQLKPEQVWTVDREDGQSVFRHLAKEDMSAWLEDYSLGDLWEKNILGGRP
jgi:predicted ATPase